MKISLQWLSNYIEIPAAISADLPKLWNLLEDIGLEVKKVETDAADHIITFELLANRGDHHCYVGIAREIHGRTGWPLQHPLEHVLAMSADGLGEPIAVDVLTDLCLRFSMTAFALETEQTPLPAEIQAIIGLSSTHLVTPAVDITNFINLELGQPMHAFDADHIEGKIEVRLGRAGETAQLLGAATEVVVPENAIVIADQVKILAIAGVMGCESSKSTEATKRVYLESAVFDPISVRKTARALGISSLASTRFERGGDPELAINALPRARMLFAAAGWQQVNKTWVSTSPVAAPVSLVLELAALNSFFAASFTGDELAALLTRYGFACTLIESGIEVDIPSQRRWDISRVEDLYEEIARGIGYNNLPTQFPAVGVGARPRVLQAVVQEQLEPVLHAHGLFEVFTDSFYSDQDVERLGLAPGHLLMQHVRINNSETKAYSLLKSNNLVQALLCLGRNQNLKVTQIGCYERNRRYLPNRCIIEGTDVATDGLCHEFAVVWGLLTATGQREHWQGRTNQDVYTLKGMFEQLAQRLGQPLQFKTIAQLSESWAQGLTLPERALLAYSDLLHPHRTGVVWRADDCDPDTGRVVGVFGEVHPGLIARFDLKPVQPLFFEIDQSLLEQPRAPRQYQAPSTLLPVRKDLCFGLKSGLEAGYITQLLRGESQWLTKVDIVDSFELADESVRAITFALWLDPHKAGKEVFANDEMNAELDRLIQSVIAHFGADRVSQR